MKSVFFFLSILFCSLSLAANKASFCRALITDRADFAVETNSPIEHWIRDRGDIRRKIDPKLDLVYVIPVYKELANGNLERLLARLHNQEAGSSQARVVLVVNNSPGAVKKRTAGYYENQETLSYLQDLLPARDARFSLRRHRYDRRSLGNGMDVDILDYATNGTPREMGPIRKLGETHAFETHKGKERHLIVHAFDADSLMSRQHNLLVLEAFSDPSVQSLISFMEWRLEKGSSASLHATHFRERGGFGRYDRELALAGVPPFGGAPRIATRGSALKTVGGMPDLQCCEDLELLQQLDGEFEHRANWRFAVETADRARFDGFDAADRQRGLEQGAREVSEFADVHAADYRRLLKHVDFLRKTLPTGEFQLLQDELQFWYDQAVTDLTRGRGPNPFWETFGSSAFASLPETAGLSWDDVKLTSSGEPNFSVRVGSYNRALARFYALARENPQEFPVAFREARLAELRRHFVNGLASAEKPSASRSRRVASQMLADDSFTTDEALANGVEVNREVQRFNISREAWVSYLLGKWQWSIDSCELSLVQERTLIHNSRFIVRQALLGRLGIPRDGLIRRFVRERISERTEDPRVIALLTVGYRTLFVNDVDEMNEFALSAVEPRFREHLKYLIDTEERSEH